MGRKAKRGRPKVADAKVHPLSIRTTLAMRRRLEASAKANGRSLAREIETRLDESLGRQSNKQLLEQVAMGVDMIESEFGGSWRDDADTLKAVLRYLDQTFRHLATPDTARPERPEAERVFELLMHLSDHLVSLRKQRSQ